MTQRKGTTFDNLYTETIITRKVRLPYTAVGNNLERNLNKMISHLMEGKCSMEGYIQVGSMEILTYSVGLQIANDIEFEVVIKCYVCCPVNGMILPCVVKNNTGAGIRAEYTYEMELKQQLDIINNPNNPNNPNKSEEEIKNDIIKRMGKEEYYNSPIVVYLAADQYKDANNLSQYNINDEINIEVTGQRYELNDKHVNIIGKIKSNRKK